MSVYEKVKSIADEKNLSIQELEKRGGLGNGSVSKWATSMPKADSLYKVAKILNVPIEYFLTDAVSVARNDGVPEETELLQNYRQLDRRGKHKLHTVIYEELDRISSQEDPPQRIPFAASGWADITPERDEFIQEELRQFEADAKKYKEV